MKHLRFDNCHFILIDFEFRSKDGIEGNPMEVHCMVSFDLASDNTKNRLKQVTLPKKRIRHLIQEKLKMNHRLRILPIRLLRWMDWMFLLRGSTLLSPIL